MKQPKLLDYLLLVLLALIWASAFFNIKIATYSFGPVTIAFLRVFFGAIPVLLLCYYKDIKIEAFSQDWYWFALIGFINLVAPFFLIGYGIKSVQSNLAAILMSTTPLSSTVLGHFYTKNEKFNFIKTFGILIGFSGILYLFSDNLLIDENNFISALLILYNPLHAELLRIKTCKKFLDAVNFTSGSNSSADVNAIFEADDRWYVDSVVDENPNTVTLELSGKIDLTNLRLPKRRYRESKVKI